MSHRSPRATGATGPCRNPSIVPSRRAGLESAGASLFALRPATLAVAIILLGVGGWASPALAQASGAGGERSVADGAVRSYDIPAGSLSAVLTRFSADADVSLAGLTRMAEGKSSPGLQGAYSVQGALSALLAGTGIEAVPDGPARYVLRETPPGPGEARRANQAAPSAEAMLSEVEVLATAEETLKQMTGVSIITAEDIEKRPPANDLSEILATQPGVSLSGASSVGAYGNQREIDLRGMGAENTMILIDGKPVNSRQGAITRRTGDRDTGGDTNWVPVDQIERIEVIRGPAAARYGSGSSGGVVNIITKRPSDKFSGSLTAYLSRPQDELEGNGTRRMSFNLSGPISENLSFRAYGNVAKTDGDKPTINGVLDDGSPNWIAGKEGRRNRDVNGLLRWDLTPSQVLEFEGGFSRQGNIYAGDTSNTAPPDGGPMQEWAGRGAETRRVYRQNAAITHRGKWGEVGNSRITLQYENTRTINCRQGNGGRVEGNCTDAAAQQQSEQDNYFLNGELNTPFKLGGLDHMLTTGFEYRRQKIEDNNALLQGEGKAGDLADFYTLKNNTKAIFVEDNIAVTDAFLLTPGVRLDHHSQFGSNWSPSLNASYELGSGFTLKTGIARTFKAPNPYQTAPTYASALGGACPYNGLGLPADSYDCTVRGNPDLKPEISVNKEIGVAWDNQRGTNASLTYFRNDYKNKVIAEALSDVTDLDNLIDFEWVNAGKVEVSGVEGNLTLPLLVEGGRTTLRLLNNLTWMDRHHNKDTDQPISVIPKYTLNTSLQWQPTRQFSMQLTGTLYGRRKPRTVSYHGYPMIGAAVRERGSYALFGLNATYEFDKNHRVGIGVSNLLDKEIKRAARLASANSADSTTGQFSDRVVTTGAGAKTYNEPGRAYYITYTASF
jgi:ferric enterobactin receptor